MRTRSRTAPRGARVAAVAVLLAATALTFVSAPAGAQDQTIEMRGVTDGGEFYFEVDGERNPTLVMAPGQEITINIAYVGTHNLHIGPPVDEATEIVTDGSQTLSFVVPEDAPAEMEYWCDPHRELGMVGTIRVEGAGATPDGNETTNGNQTGEAPSGGAGGNATGDAEDPGGAGAVDEEDPSSAPVAEGDITDETSETTGGSAMGGFLMAGIFIAISLLFGLLVARMGSRR